MDLYIRRLDSLGEKLKVNSSESSVFSLKSSVLAVLHQALADPKTLVGFIELVSHPVVRHMTQFNEDVALARIIRTCHLFSTGTWGDYCRSLNATTTDPVSQTQFIDLGPQQIQKLKGLTLVSLIQAWAQQMRWNSTSGSQEETEKMETESIDQKHPPGSRTIPYTYLQKELDFKDRTSLEDFLIYCIYNKFVITGSRLNPHKQCLMLACCPSSSAVPSTGASNGADSSFYASPDHLPPFIFARDVPLDGNHNITILDDMIAALENIQSHGQELIRTLEMIQNQSNEKEVAEKEKWANTEKILEEVRNFTKASFQNTASSSAVNWGGSTMRGGEEKRQSKRSRGVGFSFQMNAKEDSS